MNERDFYHINHCPYSAEFLALEGVGKAQTTTEILNATQSANYSATKTLTVGSADQKPIFEFIFTTAGSVAGVKIRNYNTSDDFDDSIIINSAFSNGDTLGIDCDAKTVKKNGVAINYYGKFPKFIIGTNKLSITFSQILAEANTPATSDVNNVYADNWVAQSFRVKHTDATYRSLQMMLTKVGTPPNNLVVTIEGDNAGKPDGSAIATFTVAPGDVTTGISHVTKDNASNFSLNGDTKYWIVFKMTAGDNTNKFQAYSETTDSYAKGNKATSVNAGVAWTDDFTTDIIFYLYFGGKGAGYSIPLIINYYPRYL
jgi:hypothetical protein